MQSRRWKELIRASPDPKRAALQYELLTEAVPERVLDALEDEAARALSMVFAGSAWLSALLGQHPDWISLFQDCDALRIPHRKEGLQQDVDDAVNPANDRAEPNVALDALHTMRLRELLRIGIRDLARFGPLPEILLELSNAADVFLDGVLRVVWRQQVEKSGQPWHRDLAQEWRSTKFAVLGMGKLGGHELNYSSDVDLLFVYEEEGGTFRMPPKPRQKSTSQVVSNNQFFKRLGESFIREASVRGVEGGGVRIDMRLRPEGDAGPLARSLDGYENFYAEWGQTWERMMLLKARWVAGSETLAGEFVEVIQPFRYPRSLGEGLLGEMAGIKARLEREVIRADEIDRNVKLGRGGIREIEFIVQALQVLHGGRNPFLQNPQTLAALEKLAGYQLLPKSDALVLAESYQFLRDIEHRLQINEQRQTHTLPRAAEVLDRIARLMGFKNHRDFGAELRRHMDRVRSIYEDVLRSEKSESDEDGLPAGFDDAQRLIWRDLLASHGFREPEKGVRLIRILMEGSGVGHLSRRTGELGRQLVGRLIELCPDPERKSDAAPIGFVLSDPDRVVARLDSYINAYGARASLYELWTARPNVFDHIVKLFDRSEFLAELAIREPDIVDELEAGAHLNRQKGAAETLADLRHGLRDPDQHLWLRRYFQTEFMRLGLRDILELVPFEQANAELSALAEACVQYALEVVTRRHRMRSLPFAIVGLGKFGGAELVYGSDLDVIFVAPNRTRNLPRLQKLAGEVIELLGDRTPQGTVFTVDLRLRPDGEKGLLVNLLHAYEDYYRHRAMLWEIQALTRARWLAGHRDTGVAFETLVRRLTNFREPSLPLAAYSPGWKKEIASMRFRIEKERTPHGKDALAFKTGAGGMIDFEFIAQALAMEHGWFEPNTLRSLERSRSIQALKEPETAQVIEYIRALCRMESILRRWSFAGESVLPEDPSAQQRVAARCGYADVASFFADVARWRAGIRKVYTEVFGN